MVHFIKRLLVLLACCAAPAMAANIVQNPGFEQGKLHWETRRFLIDEHPGWAHTGPGVALTACVGLPCLNSLASGAFLSQLLPTEAGARYDLSFWTRSMQGEAEYSVFWDGVLLDTVVYAPSGEMRQVSFGGLYASLNGTLLEVHGRNDTRLIGFDDFSVVRTIPAAAPAPAPAAAMVEAPQQATPVPAPGTFMLVLGGLALMVGLARRSGPGVAVRA